MPEREPWPAGPGSEPVTRVGSCDSMMSTASTRSGSSDSSYDFLSAEEKECLLFLEETIGSLDTEADSGLSTAESEQATAPHSPRALPVTQPAPRGPPEEKILQQGLAPKRVTQSSSPHLPESQSLGLRSGSYSLPRNIHISRSQNFRNSSTQVRSHFAGHPEGLLPDSKREQVGQAPAGSREVALDLDTALIPPPEAFQDAHPEQRGGRSPTPPPHVSLGPQKQAQTSSEAMSQKARENGASGRPQPPPAASSQNSGATDAPVPSAGDAPAQPAQPAPLAAPKPRKLPPNIVLKSSRSSFHSDPQHWLSRHAEAAPRDSGPVASSLQEQRKARREALEKLGLPQDQDEPGPHFSKPASSVRLRGPRAPAPAPAPARGPAPLKAPALAQGPSPGAQEPPPGTVPAAKSTPIPIPKAPGASGPLAQAKPSSRPTLQERSIPGLRQANFKSNTLERSGVGLSSYLSAERDPRPQTSTSLGKDSFLDELSPSVLRHSRPRPASLGTGKDFAGIQVARLADLEQEQSARRAAFQGQSPDKLPRPPCVSVKISPKGVPEAHRREALKKLGLLKE